MKKVSPLHLQGWTDNDYSLFSERERRYTSLGLKTLWNSIDTTIMYADSKMLRNHGKTLTEVFHQDENHLLASGNEQNAVHSNNNRKPNNFHQDRSYHNRNNNHGSSWRKPQQEFHHRNQQQERRYPSFKSHPQGFRLPRPDRL